MPANTVVSVKLAPFWFAVYGYSSEKYFLAQY